MNDLIWFAIVMLMVGINVGHAILWYQRCKGEQSHHIDNLRKDLEYTRKDRNFYQSKLLGMLEDKK